MTMRRCARLVLAVAGTSTFSLLFAANAAANHENTMVALGDSISTAYAGTGGPFNSPGDSWSTGSNLPNSHFSVLRQANPSLVPFNLAKPGTSMDEVLTQIIDVPRNAGYVTLTAGSTEVCSSGQTNPDTIVPPDTFGKHFRGVLTQLRAQARNARVLVLSVSDWYRVWAEHKDSSEMQARWAAGAACPLLMSADPTIATDGPGGTRQTVDAVIRAYNSQLASICSEFVGFCVWDQGATFGLGFSETELSSYDGFHPSAPSGHAKVAAATAHLAGFNPHPVTASADTTPPSLTVALANRLRLRRALARGIQFSVACSETATFSAQLRIGAALANRLKLPRVVGRAAAKPCSAAGRVGNRAQFTTKAKRKLAKLNAVRISVLVKAVDQAGNRANRSRTTRLSR